MPPGERVEVTDAQILAAAAELGVLGAGQGTIPLIMSRLCDPLSTAQGIAQVIRQEPGLTARVLRVANSAYYGVSGRVATLERAFVLLGVDSIRGIAAAACLNRATARAMQSSPFDLASMQGHAVAVACAAEALARVSSRALSAEAFIAGLLHDFGVLLQWQVDRARQLEIIALLQTDPLRNPREAERAVGCVDHDYCAALVFRTWKLPQSLVDAVEHHHEPMAAPETSRRLAALVHVAGHAALSVGHVYPLEPSASPLQQGALETAGLDEASVVLVGRDLPARVRELQRLLSET